MASSNTLTPNRPTSEPTWEIARLFPDQGHWTEDDYLALNTNQLVEFSHGLLEFPPMPTFAHQRIAFWLSQRLEAFAKQQRNGIVVPAPYKVRLWAGKFREPDVCFFHSEHRHQITPQFSEGADLVIEVVSDDDRRRELDIKRTEYARAGIPEYWIVDPKFKTITVLRLDQGSYVEHGVFAEDEFATSQLLNGFEVSVAEVLAAADV